jgi:carboxyl-terminal processing protease
MEFPEQNNIPKENLPPSLDIQTSPPQKNSTFSYFKPAAVFILALLVLFGVFRLGYNIGKSGYSFSAKEFKLVNRNNPNQEIDYSLLWQALDVVSRKYIDKDQIDQKKVLYGAINGAVRAAGDEYTEFFDPETLSAFRTELKGTFSGIGAEIGKENGNIVIIAPIEDSPAEKAGLRAKDVIVKINDTTVTDWSTDQAANTIRGEAGSSVKLTIYREGQASTFDVTIVRAQIEVKSVKVSYREYNGKQIAIINISKFGDDTKKLFDAAVADIQSKNVSGIVVDVRNNPGGYLDTSVEVSSDWLQANQLIVKEAHSEKDVIDYYSTGSNRLGNVKTVVLINGGSASAAEILAGALKDNGKAQLIGEKSFGKGSVQELVPLTQDTAVKVTIAKWITPSGKNLNKDGLVPDIEVKLTDDDITNNRDPQLDRALQEVAK